jgi:hypothetical protein
MAFDIWPSGSDEILTLTQPFPRDEDEESPKRTVGEKRF